MKIAAWLMTVALLVLSACAGPERLEPGDHEPFSFTVGDVVCSVFIEDGRCWCVIEGPAGQELAAVAFDPDTGEEDWSTQRFFGHDEGELLDLSDEGRVTEDAIFNAQVASCLWATGLPEGPGTTTDRGTIERQSQLLSWLVGTVARPDRSNELHAYVWNDDHCSMAPDFDFSHCCYMHDRCYGDGGSPSDRRRCDRSLRDCIAGEGHPLLAPVYYAAVRAFGWAAFGV